MLQRPQDSASALRWGLVKVNEVLVNSNVSNIAVTSCNEVVAHKFYTPGKNAILRRSKIPQILVSRAKNAV